MSKLYVHEMPDLTLAEALAARTAVEPPTTTAPKIFALLYAPAWCRFALAGDGGRLLDEKGAAIDLGVVFEAKVFSAACELRWLHEACGRGTAALLSETAHDFGSSTPLTDVAVAQRQTYLLWGEGTGKSPGAGWSWISTSRIGKLEVPVPEVAKNQRVRLTAVEYLQEIEDCDGNVAVTEERLTGLEVADG